MDDFPVFLKLATRLWGDRYQVIVATHLDKENHLHNHFVLNTVSFADGIKYHRTRKDYHEMQAVSDALCREYGLSVIEHPQQGRGKQYGEWRAEQAFWKQKVRDQAVTGQVAPPAGSLRKSYRDISRPCVRNAVSRSRSSRIFLSQAMEGKMW